MAVPTYHANPSSYNATFGTSPQPYSSISPGAARLAGGSAVDTPSYPTTTLQQYQQHQAAQQQQYQPHQAAQQQQYQQPQVVRHSPAMLSTPAQYQPHLLNTHYGSQPDSARATSEIGERRHVKSVILQEELLGEPPQESVRYVEVPYIEEVVRHVPRHEIREVEKFVPKIEIEYVERVVEVPQIQYVDKTVEVPQVREVIKHIPRREIVEVPKEVVRHVPRVETKIVERIVQVPGEIIEVPKPYIVENKVQVKEHHDKEVPLIVAQTLRPVLYESDDYVEVDVKQYEPEMIPIDIHVPRGVKTELISAGVVDEHHRVVQVPPAQYNTMLRMLNPHLAETDNTALPYVQGMEGHVQFLTEAQRLNAVQPHSGIEIAGWKGVPTRSRNYSKPGSYYSKADRGVSTVNGSAPRTQNSKKHSKTLRNSKKPVKGACPC